MLLKKHGENYPDPEYHDRSCFKRSQVKPSYRDPVVTHTSYIKKRGFTTPRPKSPSRTRSGTRLRSGTKSRSKSPVKNRKQRSPKYDPVNVKVIEGVDNILSQNVSDEFMKNNSVDNAIYDCVKFQEAHADKKSLFERVEEGERSSGKKQIKLITSSCVHVSPKKEEMCDYRVTIDTRDRPIIVPTKDTKSLETKALMDPKPPIIIRSIDRDFNNGFGNGESTKPNGLAFLNSNPALVELSNDIPLNTTSPKKEKKHKKHKKSHYTDYAVKAEKKENHRSPCDSPASHENGYSVSKPKRRRSADSCGEKAIVKTESSTSQEKRRRKRKKSKGKKKRKRDRNENRSPHYGDSDSRDSTISRKRPPQMTSTSSHDNVRADRSKSDMPINNKSPRASRPRAREGGGDWKNKSKRVCSEGRGLFTKFTESVGSCLTNIAKNHDRFPNFPSVQGLYVPDIGLGSYITLYKEDVDDPTYDNKYNYNITGFSFMVISQCSAPNEKLLQQTFPVRVV